MDVEDQHLRRVGPSPGVSERQRKWQPLGQVLVKRGLLSHEQLTAGFEAAAPRRAAVRRVLIERNIISEAALLEGLADQFDKPLMTEEELATIPPEVVRILPEETARANMVIAIEDNAEIDFCVSTLPTIYGERIVRGQRLLQRNDANDNTVVTISQVDAGMITGGGYLVMQNSAGTIAGDPGTRKNFGFYVKYNKSGTNYRAISTLLGERERRDQHVYQIKTNPMTALAVSRSLARTPCSSI